MATEFQFDPIFEAESAALWASLDEDIGSDNYDQQLRDEHAVAMRDQIDALDFKLANAAVLPSVKHDLDIIIANMRRIMPALD